ncbi:MAG TPA: hypothetical protein DEF45_05645 [Rhodopirellula sp.]|nr:hypothetical protein [Rhodopirellula sp.]
MISKNDKDGDGSISADEIKAIDSKYQEMFTSADTDSDGSVTKAELTQAMKKRMGESR